MHVEGLSNPPAQWRHSMPRPTPVYVPLLTQLSLRFRHLLINKLIQCACSHSGCHLNYIFSDTNKEAPLSHGWLLYTRM